MNANEARKLVLKAMKTVTVGDPSPIADMTILFRDDDDTFSVADNGEEVSGLDRKNAIRIIVENLA